MNLAVDVRSIMYGKYTGIGEYTYQLLEHIFAQDHVNTYDLFCNSQKETRLPNWETRHANVHSTIFHYPNKLLHGSMLAFKKPNIQSMLEARVGRKMDALFLPNQNFITRSEGTKLIITVHDLSFVRFPEFFTPFHRFWHSMVDLKRLASQAHRIVSVSEHTSNDLQELWGIDPNKIRVIHPGLDPLLLRPHAGTANKLELPEKYLLFLGTLEPRKNIVFVLDLFDEIAKSHKDIHLVLAGGWGWETEGIKQRLKQSPNQDRIKLLGYVPREAKPELYARAKAFLFPSFYEGFGFPPLEAMSQRCPVLTSNHSSLPEVVKDGAVTLPVTDQTPWLLALREILSNPQSFAPMITRGRHIASEYQWQRAAEQTLAVFNECSPA